MAVLVDTSVWVDVFRDSTHREKANLLEWLGEHEVLLTRFVQLELLQGAKNDREWSLLSTYLEGQHYLEASTNTWPDAARIYFELRRQGLTVRSPIDCCIAQLALDHGVALLHKDHDFEVIASVRPLRQIRLTSH